MQLEITHQPSPRPPSSKRRRVVATALVVIGVGAMGGVARGMTQHDPARATSPTTFPALANSAGTESAAPFDPTAKMSATTRDCFTSALQHSHEAGAYACLSVNDMVTLQRAYLRQETDATAEQVDCVVDRMTRLPIEDLRAAQSAVGQNFYVPCGLPD